MPVKAQQVERDERLGNRAVAVEHALAEQRPMRRALVVEGDELAVEDEPAWKRPGLRPGELQLHFAWGTRGPEFKSRTVGLVSMRLSVGAVPEGKRGVPLHSRSAWIRGFRRSGRTLADIVGDGSADTALTRGTVLA